MRLPLKLLAGGLVLGIPLAASAQDATTTQDPAQQPTAQQPASQTPAQQPATQPNAAQQTPTAAVKKATKDDLKVGTAVFDQKGESVGKIESNSADGAVVSTGNARAEIPLSSFGVTDKGLAIGMTKTELEAAAKAKAPQAKEEPKAKEPK